MNEQDIPIDINTNKLLDWLISRRHVSKDWQNNIISIREKINNAIQDMPAHDGIVKLLSGQHINYFHCLKIVEILKETEADTKNLFGRYGSQKMKNWQEIIALYQKDNVYLAEAAQLLLRNANYEIPSLRKQVAKLEQTREDAEKKIKDYNKNEITVLKEFNVACEQLGIPGKNIKKELIDLVKELPKINAKIAEKTKITKNAIEVYEAFSEFLTGKKQPLVVPVLKFLVQNGNVTTYEYIYGEKPIKVELPELDFIEENSENVGDEIDFGNGDSNTGSGSVDYGDIDSIDFGDSSPSEGGNIDWGDMPTEDEFEILEHPENDINLEESGIVVEHSGLDGGVAKGQEALTILDNPETRDGLINDLLELESFLKIRLYEMSNDSDLLSMSQMQEAPSILQMQTVETIASLSDTIHVALTELTNKRNNHLHNLKHSPKYVDILASSLSQKLSIIERIRASKVILEVKIVDNRNEVLKLQPVISLLIEKTKNLQRDIELDLSKKYKGRVVNIVGGINML